MIISTFNFISPAYHYLHLAAILLCLYFAFSASGFHAAHQVGFDIRGRHPPGWKAQIPSFDLLSESWDSLKLPQLLTGPLTIMLDSKSEKLIA